MLLNSPVTARAAVSRAALATLGNKKEAPTEEIPSKVEK
jgi:hypothetical protein